MIIDACLSGGFSGQTCVLHADTSKLINGHTIETFIRDSGFFSASEPEHIGADLARWEITVRDAAQERTLRFVEDGSAASAPWQVLLSYLRAAR